MNTIAIKTYTSTNSLNRNSGLRITTKILVFAVACLIFKGALVTSHQAGLAVPDWPTTFGYNMFLYPISKWQGGIFYEHGHRLLASLIGVITLIIFVWTLFVEKRSPLKLLTLVALLVVITQGVLGGLTVLYLLPTPISVSHAVLAQTFLLIALAIAYFHSREFLNREALQTVKRNNSFVFSAISLGMLYIQLFFGALMRHTHSGLAVPDFPTMGGHWLPNFNNQTIKAINTQLAQLSVAPVDYMQIMIHMTHRTFAFVVLAFLTWSTIKIIKRSDSAILRKNGLWILAVLLIQFCLGVFTIWSGKQPVITSLHVVFGAILLGLVALQTLRLYSWPEKLRQ